MKAGFNTLLQIINNATNEISSTKDNKFSDKEKFLLALLKNIDDKNLVKELIDKSNLSKDQKEKIFKQLFFESSNTTSPNIKPLDIKSDDKNNPKQNLLNLAKVHITDKANDKSSQNHFNINNIKTNSKSTKEEVSSSTSNSNSKNSIKKLLQTELTEEEINILNNLQSQLTNVIKQEHELVKKIKTTIIQKSINNSQLKEIIITQEFKNATSFKDLINLSKKYKLNLTKIAISKENDTKKIKPEIKDSINIQTTKPLKIPHNIKPLNIKNIANNKTQTKENNISIQNLIQLSTNKKINKNSEKLKDINNNQILKETFNYHHQQKEVKVTKNKSENKENNENNFQLSSPTPIETLKSKIIEAKQTIKHFSTSLKEAIENYKPPITKLSLELNPKELGKVEVTLKQRGDNLHVQINTNNQNAITFFTTQQQELKNALVNMGFTNIDMNFNANQEQKKDHQQNKKQKDNYQQHNEEELVIDMTYKYA